VTNAPPDYEAPPLRPVDAGWFPPPDYDLLEPQTIEGNTSTSVPTGKDNTSRDSDLPVHLDQELISYITISEAYTQALQMKTPDPEDVRSFALRPAPSLT
jgi:hypothetical protein